MTVHVGGLAVVTLTFKILSRLYLGTGIGSLCLVMTLARECGYASSWFVLNLTFDLAVVTFQILTQLFLRNYEV